MLHSQLIYAVCKDFNIQPRSEQVTVMLEYMRNKDCMFIAPTGFGKSILFQLAPFLLSNETDHQRLKPSSNRLPSARVIVIQPTIALITDSIAKLGEMMPEVTAVHLTRAALPNAREATFIFSSPESILDERCGRVLLADESFRKSVKAVFVDECHLIGEWGRARDPDREQAFRVQFAELGQLRSIVECSFVALTATANEEMQSFVKQTLYMTTCTVLKVEINKPNISYHVVSLESKSLNNFDFIINMISAEGRALPRTLVFFKDTSMLSTAFAYICHKAELTMGDPNPIMAMFTSLTSTERQRYVLDQLANDNTELRIVLCTSALSVGVHLMHIEYVIHYGAPASTNAFLQETGRAAREAGSHAQSVTLVYPRMFAGHRPTDSMKQYVATKECRRQILLRDYHQAPVSVEGNRCCDNCGAWDSLVVARILPSRHDLEWSDMSSSDGVPSIGDLELGASDFSDTDE